jgi:hypothetical protein
LSAFAALQRGRANGRSALGRFIFVSVGRRTDASIDMLLLVSITF